jgi:transcriptional regulator with XRE-family HTH domain
MAKSVFTDEYAELIERLVEARKAARVTQVELGERLDKPQSWISKTERGLRRLDVLEFYAIARALKRDPADLFGEVTSTLPKRVSV